MVSLRPAGVLALSLLLLASGGKELPPPPARASLAVRAGRATLVQGEEIRVLTRAAGRRDVRGEAYAEVGALSELEIAWPGNGSLRVHGPAALEWGPSGGVRLLRADRFELEVRRGGLAVELPGGWAIAMDRGAIGGSERTSGDWVIENRGGTDAALWRDREAAGGLAGGASVLLPVGRAAQR